MADNYPKKRAGYLILNSQLKFSQQEISGSQLRLICLRIKQFGAKSFGYSTLDWLIS